MSLLMDALKKADQAQKNHASLSNQSALSSPTHQENSTPLEPPPLATELEKLEVETDNFATPIAQERQSQPLEFELIELTEDLETSTTFNVDELPDSDTHNWDEELLPQFQQTKPLTTDPVTAARNSPAPSFEKLAPNAEHSDTSKPQKPIPLFTLQKTADDEHLEDNIASKLLGEATELDHIPKSADSSSQTAPSPAKAQRLLTARQKTSSSGTGRKKFLYSTLVLILLGLGGFYYYYEFLLLPDQVVPYRPGLKLPPPSSQTAPAIPETTSALPVASDQQSQTQKLAISSPPPAPEPVATPTMPSPPITESISMEEVMPADHVQDSAIEKTTAQQPAPKPTNIELTETQPNNPKATETARLTGTIPQETSVQPVDKKQSTQTKKSNKTAEKPVLSTSIPNNPPLSTESSATALSVPNSQVPALQEEKLQLQKKLTSMHAELTDAYHAFQQGNWGMAQQTYHQILQQDERNKDALLGLAAIAAQQGDKGKAQQYYQQVLYFYPQDFDAQAGLLANSGHASTATESQLKLLLARSPETAHLHFSLGNLYANQGRWSQAQQAYFEAYRYENNRADYAYNLAISLDQINQPQTALDYYQKSLQLAQHQAINFNLQSVQQRIRTLQTQMADSVLKAH